MPFCVNCGHELSENIKFCAYCGEPVNEVASYAQRKTVYEGELHKCPNCGELLESFVTTCPSCGCELRGTQVSSAIKEFALKLEAIESSREYERPPQNWFAALEAKESVSKTDAQKIDLIKSFPVPNSKEDMLEFMILATSSINATTYDSFNIRTSQSEKKVNAAWFSKIQQIYEKSKHSNFTDSTFVEIKSLYDACNVKIKKFRKKGVVKWALVLGAIVFCLTLLLLLSPIRDRKEITRLEMIVSEIETQLENGEYRYALLNADSLVYNRDDTEQKREWAVKREYWIDRIIEEAEKNGIILLRPTEEKTTGSSSGESSEPSSQISEFDEGTFDTITVKNYRFDLPKYWGEEGSKNEYLQYYAEKGDRTVMLSIAYPKESDDDYDVSFNGLCDDNDNMIKAIEKIFDGDVVGYEIFETAGGVKGILYRFTCKIKVGLFKKVDGSGYYFCFPSEDDRRWFFVVIVHTNKVNSEGYEEDFMKLLSSINKKT